MRICRSQRRKDRQGFLCNKDNLKNNTLWCVARLFGKRSRVIRCRVCSLFSPNFMYRQMDKIFSFRRIRAHVSSFNTEAHDDLKAKRVLSPQASRKKSFKIICLPLATSSQLTPSRTWRVVHDKLTECQYWRIFHSKVPTYLLLIIFYKMLLLYLPKAIK